MTISNAPLSEPHTAFVWIWLPDESEPVVCGRLDLDQDQILFTYARSYKNRPDAVPIFEPELPLNAESPVAAADGTRLPLCIDDAMPDSWGRRLVNYRLQAGFAELSELTYLLSSGSDRIGALDFQVSSDRYVPREDSSPTLEELADAARLIEEGKPLHERLTQALLHGTSIGGARPKALLRDGESHLIAKFSSTTDTYPVVKGEFVAMSLARRCGLDVAPVSIIEIHGRSALLVERFDRPGGLRRQRVVSAVTVLGMNTFPGGRYATYALLADAVRGSFMEPDVTLRELFGRISFNILCGNTDDHGRNHAALVFEHGLRLSPAYDICPQPRGGSFASQAMAYDSEGTRISAVAPLIRSAAIYHLDPAAANGIVQQQVQTIRDSWNDVCDEARLTVLERDQFMGGQFLNPVALEA
ncbi:MAG: hypothetical protein RLZ37_1411 [Actinomycetota bacterium]